MEEDQSARKRSEFSDMMPEDWGPLPDSHRWIVRLFLLVLGNFLLFGLVWLWIGGDALNGHAENGHFFLSKNGNLTEVNRWVYFYSLVHTLSVILTLPLAGFCWLAIRGYRVP